MLEDDDIEADGLVPKETVGERWGEGADAGFTAVPNVLIRAQARLGLSANELIVLLNILLHWWSRDRLPHPRSTAIAKRSGLGHRTVQRSLRTLEAKGLIAGVRGSDGERKYDLKGLRAALAAEVRSDAWFRPTVVRRSGNEIGAGAGVQSPTPQQP